MCLSGHWSLDFGLAHIRHSCSIHQSNLHDCGEECLEADISIFFWNNLPYFSYCGFESSQFGAIRVSCGIIVYSLILIYLTTTGAFSDLRQSKNSAIREEKKI